MSACLARASKSTANKFRTHLLTETALRVFWSSFHEQGYWGFFDGVSDELLNSIGFGSFHFSLPSEVTVGTAAKLATGSSAQKLRAEGSATGGKHLENEVSELKAA